MADEKWVRTNEFATPRHYTGALALSTWLKQCLNDEALCLLEKGDLAVICHRDDVQEVERELGVERDIYAEKVDWVVAWLVRRGVGDTMSCERAAKDLVAAGFEAGFKPELVKDTKPPTGRVKVKADAAIRRAIDIVDNVRHLLNAQQLAQLAELKSML